MIDAVKYKLSGANDLGLNTWNVTSYDHAYAYDGDDEQNVRTLGTFVHSNGTLTTGNDTVNISFIQFSGVRHTVFFP